MNILHIFKSTGMTFYQPYIEFINKNFDSQSHHFMIEVYNRKNNNENHIDNRDYVNKFQYIKLIKRLYMSDKIILHSLMSPRLVLILFFNPWLLKKCYWTIWGADLYYYKNRNKTFKSNVYEFFRKHVIRNIGGLITYIKGDFELAKKWYGAKGKYYYSFMYPSNLYKEYNYNKSSKQASTVYIQIGNSADISNNHIEVFEKLKIYKNEDIEIICPLSYGDKKYIEMVIKEGKKIFGEKFIPVLKFLPKEEYLKLLDKIDIAIFNHKRQQAMGNIITLLGLGKKIYIRNNITTWQFCLDHGLKVFDLNGSLSNLFDKMDESTKQKNIENVKRQFSEEKLIKDWKKIFRAGDKD